MKTKSWNKTQKKKHPDQHKDINVKHKIKRKEKGVILFFLGESCTYMSTHERKQEEAMKLRIDSATDHKKMMINKH